MTLESLLIGHEDWVHSACWQPLPASSPAPGQAEAAGAGGGSGGGLPGRSALALLTASMDRTMMLWTCDVRGARLLRTHACAWRWQRTSSLISHDSHRKQQPAELRWCVLGAASRACQLTAPPCACVLVCVRLSLPSRSRAAGCG